MFNVILSKFRIVRYCALSVCSLPPPGAPSALSRIAAGREVNHSEQKTIVAISANERDQAAAMLRAVLAEHGLSPGESIAIMLCAIERIVRDHVAPNELDFTIGACAGALQLLAARQQKVA